MNKKAKTLSIDIETYSRVDLGSCGVYPYVEDEDFEILLFAYAFDDEEVKVLDIKQGEGLPLEIFDALTDPNVLKAAFNANFERTCLSRFYEIELPPEQWSCTQVMALSLGLPGSLGETAACLNLDERKLSEGKSLVRFFCSPSKGENDMPSPQDNVDKWERFKAYCGQDVEVERAIRKRLEGYELSEREQRLWCLDQRINDRGIMSGGDLIKRALDLSELHHSKLTEEAVSLTGLQNPNSPLQLKKWFKDEGNLDIKSLSKGNVEELLREASDEKIKRVLEIRQLLSKTSIKKYEAMERAVCRDGRLRGLFQFCGASRTGRWAGRLVQVQNLPQIKLEDIGGARELLKAGEYETLDALYESLPEVLSQLIRTTLIPSEGNRLLGGDFSAIEARVLAWLSGERWRLEAFETHGKIYEASASRMFHVPLESIDKASPLRQKGKIAELALGYQGAKGALLSMGALQMGLKEEELDEIVRAWRATNQNIVLLWRRVEKAAVEAVRYGNCVSLNMGLHFYCDGGILFIVLPSGRRLSYIKPRIELDEKFGKLVLTYEGNLQGAKKWERQKTYGGRLVENIVQAIARDCLAEAMLNLDEAGYPIVMHIHDEIVMDVPKAFGSKGEVKNIMSKPIPWAPGLKLDAEVFESEFYCK